MALGTQVGGRRRRRWGGALALVLVVLVVGSTACGDDGDDGAATRFAAALEAEGHDPARAACIAGAAADLLGTERLDELAAQGLPALGPAERGLYLQLLVPCLVAPPDASGPEPAGDP